MKKLKKILGFEFKYDDDGNVEVYNVCNYPQETTNCKELYKKLEQIKINESKITFPVRIKKWLVTINPINIDTILEYFSINGIKKIVEENKSKLIGKITFVKAEIQYPKKAKYPNLHIHFFQIVNDGGIELSNINEMVDYFSIYYDNTKQFTKKRIEDLEKYVNTKELFQIPFLPIELGVFNDNGDIMPLESHELAIKSAELPF